MTNLTLTALETQLLKGLTEEKIDDVEYRAWNESSLHYHINAPKKSTGGVVASLLKKGMIELAFIDDVQIEGSFNFREEKFYSITDAGLKAIQAEDQAEVQAEEVQAQAQENKALSLSDCEDMTCEQLHITVANALKVLAGIYKQNDKRDQGQEIETHSQEISWMDFEHSREFRDVKVIDRTKANLKKRIEALDSIKYDLVTIPFHKTFHPLKKELANYDYKDLELELMCVELSFLTHWNHHNEALLLLAETIGQDWQIKAMETIIAKHKELGKMTPMLIETREKMRQVLFTDKSYTSLSPELQAKIWEAC